MTLKKEDINNVLDSLSNLIDKEHYEESQNFIQNITKVMSEETLSNPERFHLLVKYGMDKKLRSLLKFINQTYFSEDKMRDKSVNNFIFLFLNYGYLECHIEELCRTKLQTSACSCDIARYLLAEVYLPYLRMGVIKDTQLEVEKFYKPAFGTNEQWINYIDSLIFLYYGKTKKYFEAYNALLSSEIMHYKHLVHQHKLTFLKNNQTVDLPCTFDKDTEPSLLKSADGVNYKVFRYNIPEDLLSTYKSVYKTYEGPDKGMFAGYYFVPMNEVKIETETKEEFI